jgi:hypothetical protein
MYGTCTRCLATCTRVFLATRDQNTRDTLTGETVHVPGVALCATCVGAVDAHPAGDYS